MIDGLAVPLDVSVSETLGFDLDGDSAIDNQMGQIFAAFDEVGNDDYSPQTPFAIATDTGTILFLSRATASERGTTFESYVGTNPDPEPCLDVGELSSCRQHLDGTGSFDIDTSYPTDRLVLGAVDRTTYAGQDGTMLLPIAFPSTDPVWVELTRASVELSTISEFELEGRIGGMISDEQVQAVLLPAFRASIVATMQRDCTGAGENCGCVASSAGDSWREVFDADEDCDVTLLEVTSSPIASGLWAPDVDSDDDGTADSLSIGVGVTGVRATF